ncbi:hypothetical protein [Neobacillus vireti]|uniref:hypothetical protein n=1 Tax=Neobacillus vireti TaxID=220686 RepID=UPI002FFF834C
MTEIRSKKGFGSMQGCWSDRIPIEKGFWVNARVLERPKSDRKRVLGQCRGPGVTEPDYPSIWVTIEDSNNHTKRAGALASSFSVQLQRPSG